MATISASAVTAALLPRRSCRISTSPALGLPQLRRKEGGGVKCSAEKGKGVAGASVLAGAAGSMLSLSGPAFALVDERMSTEGTGLSLGLSSNLLGWILLGVFGLIWALYFVYASSLEEDEESGLSL